MIQIFQMIGNDMDDDSFPLQLAGHPDQSRAHDYLAISLERLRPDDNVGDGRFVLQRDEDDATGGARALPDQRDSATVTRVPSVVCASCSFCMTWVTASSLRSSASGWVFTTGVGLRNRG